MDLQPLLRLAEQLQEDDGYTYERFARDMTQRLGWEHAAQAATALRGYVYGSPGQGPCPIDARPLYERLGWEQSALVASWFRDARNRPDSKKPKRRPDGWPGPQLPSARRTEP